MSRRKLFLGSLLVAGVLLGLGWWVLGRGVLIGLGSAKAWEKPLVHRDLDSIRTDTLRVLILQDPLSWEERPKAASGLEFELLLRFAKQLDLPMVVVPMDHPDSMLMALQLGRGDIIAAQLTSRKDLRQWVNLTRPYRRVRPVLATLRPDPHVVNVPKGSASVDRSLDTAFLSPLSPFADPAYRFDTPSIDHFKLHIDPRITPEDLLMEVVLGRHRAAVITDARAMYGTDRFPVLEFGPAIGPEQGLHFAVRRNSPQLLKRLNDWLEDDEEKEAREMYIQAYGGRSPASGPLVQRKVIPVRGDSLSPFDDHFRAHADLMRWDWELLAAMAWRESRFDSTVSSRKGAQGIMQIMPRTGKRLGLDTASVMEDHIRAAAVYLSKLDTLWIRAIPDKEQRLRFVLASYNAGPGHIIDAQRLARSLGLDPDRWEHNVERTVLLLAQPRYYMQPEMKNGYCKGSQVFQYVREVLHMYRQLKAHGLPDGSGSVRDGMGTTDR